MNKEKKIQYSVWKKEANSAGGKAKNDAFDIALNCGFMPSYKPSNNRTIRGIQQLLSLHKMKKADVLFVQYPAIENRIQKILAKYMNPTGVKIALIHDLPSIQGMQNSNKELEIEQLSCFTHLIVHNVKMEQYIRQIGFTGKIVRLELFDYLHDTSKQITDEKFCGSISIAGNLKKSKYILDLGRVDRCNFELYGIKGDMDFSNISNVQYNGMLSSEEIVYKLTGDYGLVWDGDSIESCTGVYGRYLLYNNPHKLSLCMAAGKPVIVWKRSAVADFVQREGVGICVDSLLELNTIDLKKDYDRYKANVLNIKKKVAEGFYLKTTLNRILEEEG